MMTDVMRKEVGAPKVVDRTTFDAQLDALRVREKAHTHEGDAIAAARRRLPMVEVDPAITLIGPRGAVKLLDVFERRRQLIAYYFMWHTGHPAPEQCEGCTWVTTQVRELSYLHSRDVTFAVFCQGPYDESEDYLLDVTTEQSYPAVKLENLWPWRDWMTVGIGVLASDKSNPDTVILVADTKGSFGEAYSMNRMHKIFTAPDIGLHAVAAGKIDRASELSD